MPRQPKPYFRKQTKSWYCSIGGRQISLGKDREAAHVKFHELMTNRDAISSELTKWKDSNPRWSDNSANDAISIVQRMINWAVDEGYLHRTPSLDEFHTLLAMAKIKSVVEFGDRSFDHPESSPCIDKITVEALTGPTLNPMGDVQ